MGLVVTICKKSATGVVIDLQVVEKSRSGSEGQLTGEWIRLLRLFEVFVRGKWKTLILGCYGVLDACIDG